MTLIGWFRDRTDGRHADLDGRVLAELARLGESRALDVRRTVRTQHAVLQASLIRLEQAGAIGSRLDERQGDGRGDRVYFVRPPAPS